MSFFKNQLARFSRREAGSDMPGPSPRNRHVIVPGRDSFSLAAMDARFESQVDGELQTKRWLVEHAESDWFCLDLGAGIGCYSILLSELASSGRTIALEPSDLREKLRRNVSSSTPHGVEILDPSPGVGVDELVAGLRADRLDCIRFSGRFASVDVLTGAEQSLIRFRPWIVLQFDTTASVSELTAVFYWFSSRGYEQVQVCDRATYILRMPVDASRQSRGALTVNLDRTPILLPSKGRKGEAIAQLFQAIPETNNDAKVSFAGSTAVIEVKGPRWNYAAQWMAIQENVPGCVVEIDVSVVGGMVGFSFLGIDGSTIVGEASASEAGASRKVILQLADRAAIKALLLRNVDVDGTAAEVRVSAIACYEFVPTQMGPVSKVMAAAAREVSSADMLEALGNKRPAGQGDRAAIEIVPVENLGSALGFAVPYSPPLVIPRALADFNTERDETEIFEYIYSNFRPARHLEIGTWEGHGAATVARSCGADIWTVNLPEGERDEKGQGVYSPVVAGQDTGSNASPGAGDLLGDAGAAIGWKYRQQGFAGRVHQLLCDSRELDCGQWAPESFDTVFIDGGHTHDVVVSDTEKTLPLLRSGGLMIWHDFCPEEETLSRQTSPRGVVEAVAENLVQWRQSFQRLFWVRPSWILIGVKK